MRRSRFSEEQIIKMLREAQAGEKARDVCRRHGICEQALYRWKAKYGGMQVSDVRLTIVTVTPLAVENDSRVFKQAASVARFGYRSIVVEGGKSEFSGTDLPFQLHSTVRSDSNHSSPSTDNSFRANGRSNLVSAIKVWFSRT